jgi:hypothetical protein
MVNSHAPLDRYTLYVCLVATPKGASIVFALHLMMIIVVEFAMPFCTQNLNHEIVHLYFT